MDPGAGGNHPANPLPRTLRQALSTPDLIRQSQQDPGADKNKIYMAHSGTGHGAGKSIVILHAWLHSTVAAPAQLHVLELVHAECIDKIKQLQCQSNMSY